MNFFQVLDKVLSLPILMFFSGLNTVFKIVLDRTDTELEILSKQMVKIQVNKMERGTKHEKDLLENIMNKIIQNRQKIMELKSQLLIDFEEITQEGHVWQIMLQPQCLKVLFRISWKTMKAMNNTFQFSSSGNFINIKQESYITGLVTHIFPEDWCAELEALRSRWLQKKYPVTWIKFRTFLAILDMLRGHLCIKLDDLLTSKTQA